MPWQRYVAEVGCELLEDGRPAYREVIVTVPRQSGKTTLFLCWQLDRVLNWGRGQRSVFTAQSGKDAREKWLDEIFPLLRTSKLRPFIRKISEGNGNESVHFKRPAGSIIRVLATAQGSGHSKTAHQAVLDEIWADTDYRREQGLRPAMLTVPDAQLLVCSTAGTAASVVLNAKVEMGRQAAEEDSGSGVAYFEWSMPDGCDIDDETRWPEFMPALGYTQSAETIKAEMQAMSMPTPERVRAYGNRKTAGKDTLIPEHIWREVCVPGAGPEAATVFAVDVDPDRTRASIVAADADTVELLENRSGTDWVVGRVNELAEKHGGLVVVDARGPAASMAKDIEACDESEHMLTGPTVARACQDMYDAIVNGNVTFGSHPKFDAAIEGAVKRKSGDTFTWNRTSSTDDVTPLMAASIARWAARHPLGPAMYFSVID